MGPAKSIAQPTLSLRGRLPTKLWEMGGRISSASRQPSSKESKKRRTIGVDAKEDSTLRIRTARNTSGRKRKGKKKDKKGLKRCCGVKIGLGGERKIAASGRGATTRKGECSKRVFPTRSVVSWEGGSRTLPLAAEIVFYDEAEQKAQLYKVWGLENQGTILEDFNLRRIQTWARGGFEWPLKERTNTGK